MAAPSTASVETTATSAEGRTVRPTAVFRQLDLKSKSLVISSRRRGTGVRHALCLQPYHTHTHTHTHKRPGHS
ncbi:uncharacterized protein SETTUDRAFT_164580 [Exserohilum turcica Et28A]|uniref:Uncharacterized protein n=1 Tax=Exserohilum turcicum (strain 28A) TaxID=671987 RepID=R0ID96_EXST2|nr:uncharacterized protein SETTUDRAFT_164580 [Exserohilum turcica Et28A]EOA83111.1 hypothetical protein SETTUDRAFT_164580 [Exserohilum turcica Et28A]